MAIKCPKCNSDNPDTKQFCGDCGTQLPSIEDIEVTETIEAPKDELTRGTTFAGRYEIIEELGKGGMGRVYRVEDTKAKEEIALKLIKPEIALDKKTIERFRNELTTARKITHKNVCRMYDLGEEKGLHFITMEYISGQDLKGLIRQTGQLTVGKAISIAKQICNGLAEAHSLGVVHRDLKPSNIMIDRGGNAKIMDFGIARAMTGKSITGAGVVIGTPQYMSPEQVEGKDIDQRSDIYSLGIILYEMLTDRVPFEGDTPLTVGVKQKTETPKDPKEFNERISEGLSWLILKCLEKERESRYQSADEVRSDLEKLEHGLPTSDRVIPQKRPLTSKEITVHFSMKKIVIPAIAVVALAIIGLIIWSPWSKKGPVLIQSDTPTLAIVYFENNTGDENMERWSRSFASLLITDLSQSKILSVLSEDRLYTVLQRLNLLGTKVYSSEDLENISELAGVNYILGGMIDKAGDILIISTRLHHMDSEEQPKTRRIDTQGEHEFTNAADQLTRMIKADLNLNAQDINSDVDRLVGEITSSYPEALRLYYEGRRLHQSGDYEQSLSFMQRAVEIDPEFALAYRSMAAQPLTLQKKQEYIQKAFDLSDRASEEERLWIHGDYYYYSKNRDFNKAIETYNKLIEMNPTHSVVMSLARVYQDLGEWDLAIDYFELSRDLGMEWRGIWYYLGSLYGQKRMYQKAREVYQDYINNVRDDVDMHIYITGTYTAEGKYDEALKEADKALSLNPRGFSKAVIYHMMGDYEAAEKGYKSWLDDERIDWKMSGRRYLEILYRTLGKYKSAREEAQAGLKLAADNHEKNMIRVFSLALAVHDLETGDLDSAFERVEFFVESGLQDESPGSILNANWLKIQVHLKRNDIDKAIPLAEEIKTYVDSTPNKRDIFRYFWALGLIEIEEQNYTHAIDLFSQSYELIGGATSWIEPHAWILYKLAAAYRLNGNIEAARKEYANILELGPGRLWWGDLYVKSYYELGKIHEQQGNRAKAIEHYEIFLDLWKDADPGIAEVEDAKNRLAGLKVG